MTHNDVVVGAIILQLIITRIVRRKMLVPLDDTLSIWTEFCVALSIGDQGW